MPLAKPRCTFLSLILRLILFSSCLSSHALLAASVSAKLEDIQNQAIMQRLIFDQGIDQMQVGDTISLPLSGDQITEFSVTNKKPMADGGNIISGSSKNGEHLLLTTDQDATYGSITGNGTRFAINTDAVLGIILVDQNHAEFPVIDLGEDGIIPKSRSANLSIIEQMAPAQIKALETMQQSSSGVSNIRMLILYSNEFASGFSSPLARINQALEFTNQSMQRSGIEVEFTLALAQVLNFDNSLGTSTLLSQAQNGTGAFSGINNLRNQVGADMVAVLSFQEGFSSNGVAFVNGDNPNFAFSSTRLSPNCCDSVFAHELGHNMGSSHERASVNPTASSPCTGGGFTSFSCGHGNESGNGGQGWGTIMSRLNSGVVNDVFSNPALNCLGEPCGVPEGSPNAADNFSSFNISRLLVANFRGDPVTPPLTPPTQPTTNDTVIAPVINILLDERE